MIDTGLPLSWRAAPQSACLLPFLPVLQNSLCIFYYWLMNLSWQDWSSESSTPSSGIFCISHCSKTHKHSTKPQSLPSVSKCFKHRVLVLQRQRIPNQSLQTMTGAQGEAMWNSDKAEERILWGARIDRSGEEQSSNSELQQQAQLSFIGKTQRLEKWGELMLETETAVRQQEPVDCACSPWSISLIWLLPMSQSTERKVLF